MEVPIPEQPNPQGNLIQFKRPKREGTFKPIRKEYGSCKHMKCFVDEAKREVTCQDCKTILDPFQVLYELAIKQRRWLEELDEWDARRDSLLSERYDAQWEKDKAEISQPPTSEDELLIWNIFRDYFKGNFVSMYKRKGRLRNGPEWYGRSTYGSLVSHEYARAQLVPKLVSPKSSSTPPTCRTTPDTRSTPSAP